MLEIDRNHCRQLANKYNQPGPRYTSYPTAVEFSPTFRHDQYIAALDNKGRDPGPCSLYVHIPFCRERCHFCACAVVASPEHDRIAPRYVGYLEREMELLRNALGAPPLIDQLHLGGGTPTYLAPQLLNQLYDGLRKHCHILDDAELSVELDPRVTNNQHLDALAASGVNRLSIGIQDFDSEVQSLIGRDQSLSSTTTIVSEAKARGIGTINVDLVYGLPGQTLKTMGTTIDQVTELGVGRVAFYGYAHVPWMRANQRRIPDELLPSPELRLEMSIHARERFENAGYISIGLDHFAHPEDPLALAFLGGTVSRNFMGYTQKRSATMLGLGVTAIGDVSGAYVQNTTKLAHYYDAIDRDHFPVVRGLQRSADDETRGRIIHDLMCHGKVAFADIEKADSFENFASKFALELSELRTFVKDGILEINDNGIRIRHLGRPFVRNVAMVFDVHLRGRGDGPFSSTV